MEHDFIIFFLQYCFEHFFTSKAAMARELGVGVSTLMRIIHPPHKFKAGSVPYEHLLWYCFTHQIDVNHIFDLFCAQYQQTKVPVKMPMFHEPPVWEQACMGAITKMIKEDRYICEENQRKLLYMSRTLSYCLCQQCNFHRFYADDTDCLVIRIMRCATIYYRQH